MEWYRLDYSGSGDGPGEGSNERNKDFSASIQFWDVLE
jgi:hypothetical protein